MRNWSKASWTGSLNRYVDREVRDHIRTNSALKSLRYALPLRCLHWLFVKRSLVGFVILYIAICILAVVVELALDHICPAFLTRWFSGASADELISQLTNITGFLITAQVGVLGVVSIAVGLVTLISQREGAGTDIKVYYHSSLAMEVVASSIGLLLILSLQLAWPIHLLLQGVDTHSSLEKSKLILLFLHIAWLTFNLSALAHFVAITFQFVHQSNRERLRERYIANIEFPRDLTNRLRHTRLVEATAGLVQQTDDNEGHPDQPTVHFGINYGATEVQCNFGRPRALYDVHILILRWVVQRWSSRCRNAPEGRRTTSLAGLRTEAPTLFFPVYLDNPVRGQVTICARRGGVPLSWIERIALKLAFDFKDVLNEE